MIFLATLHGAFSIWSEIFALYITDLRKISPQVLLHELGLRDENEKAHKMTVSEVGKALAIPEFSPLTVQGWKSLLQGCGYRITHEEQGPLLTFSPKTVLRDEGPSGVARMAYNLATRRDLRERVLRTKSILSSHSDSLGYILVRAVHDDA